MNDFDQELRIALSRREPPPGFAERVAERLDGRRRGAYPRWLAAAAMFLIAIVGFSLWQTHQRRQRMAAEETRREFIRALEVTNSALENTKALIHRQTEGRTI